MTETPPSSRKLHLHYVRGQLVGIFDQDDNLVVDCGAGEMSEDDAKQFVLAMNACRNLPAIMLTDDCFEKMRQDRDQLLAQRDQLAGFARAVLEVWPDGGDLDGGDIQRIAVEHGLLIGSVVHEPCNGGDPDKACACAEYCMADEFAEGVTCYRRTDLVKGGAA